MTAQNPTNNFVEEMKMKTVIHTTYTKTEAGETWLGNY